MGIRTVVTALPPSSGSLCMEEILSWNSASEPYLVTLSFL